METNESVLTREAVALDDRKRLGKIKDLCVDCDTCSVSHYIIMNPTTGTGLVLAVEKLISFGDSFATVQSRSDFMPVSEESNELIKNGFHLVGTEVYSRAGNRLGAIESYEFDPVYGKITKIFLGKKLAFDTDNFVFFTPEFVFVDDGETTSLDVRTGTKPSKKIKSKGKLTKKLSPKKTTKSTSSVNDSESEVAPEPVAASEVVPEEVTPEVTPEPVVAPEVKVAPLPEVEPEPVSEPEEEIGVEDDELKLFLIGQKVTEDVESVDGAFKVSQGTELTQQLIDEAEKHDALLLLTMSVDA